MGISQNTDGHTDAKWEELLKIVSHVYPAYLYLYFFVWKIPA